MINRNGDIVYLSVIHFLFCHILISQSTDFFQASGLNFFAEKNITRSTYINFVLVTGPAKAVLSTKNVLMRNVPWSIHTSALIL